MNQIIMWIMAVGTVLGGVDRIAGNRFGFGKRFEEGFMLLGPTALSMSALPLSPFRPRSHLELFWAGCGTSRRHSRH